MRDLISTKERERERGREREREREGEREREREAGNDLSKILLKFSHARKKPPHRHHPVSNDNLALGDVQQQLSDY